jgi:hypothetical protein
MENDSLSGLEGLSTRDENTCRMDRKIEDISRMVGRGAAAASAE